MVNRQRVYVIRHGQVSGYERFPVYGHTDVDLTETGLIQIRQISERLRFTDIISIYASDLKRSVQGAHIIGAYHNVPLSFLPELREMYFGDWEGLSLTEIQKDFPNELERRKKDLINFAAPGGGETLAKFSERITKCYNKILKTHKDNDIAIIAHGGVNRIILCKALGLDITQMFNFHQDYGCLNIIDYYPDSKLVQLVNG